MPLPLIPILASAASAGLGSLGTIVGRSVLTKVPGKATASKLTGQAKAAVSTGKKVLDRGKQAKRAGDKVMDFFKKRNVEEKANDAMGGGGVKEYLDSLPGMERSGGEGEGFVSAMSAIAMSTMSGRDDGAAGFPIELASDADFQEPQVQGVVQRLEIIERRLDEQNEVLSSIQAVIQDGVQADQSDRLRRRRESQEEEAEAKKGILGRMGLKAKDFVGAAALTAAVPLIDKATNIAVAGTVMAAGYVASNVSSAIGFMRGEDRAATPKEIEEEYGSNIETVDLIEQATTGFGTDENALIYAMQQIKTQTELDSLKKSYEEKYGETLDSVLKSELANDEYRNLMVQLRNQFVASQQQSKGLELTKEVKSFVSDDYMKDNYSEGVSEDDLDAVLLRAGLGLEEEKGVLAKILQDLDSVTEFQAVIQRYNERTGKSLVAELKDKLGRQEYYRLRDNIAIRERNGVKGIEEMVVPDMIEAPSIETEVAEAAPTFIESATETVSAGIGRFKNNVSLIYNHYFGEKGETTEKLIETIETQTVAMPSIVQQTFDGDTNIQNLSQQTVQNINQSDITNVVYEDQSPTQQIIVKQETNSGVRDPRPMVRDQVAPITTQVFQGNNIVNETVQKIVPDTDFFGGAFDFLKAGLDKATALSGDALGMGANFAKQLAGFQSAGIGGIIANNIGAIPNVIGSIRDASPLPASITEKIVEKIPQINPLQIIREKVDSLGSIDILDSVSNKVNSALSQFSEGRAGILRKIAAIGSPSTMVTELITNQITKVAPTTLGDQITNVFGGDTSVIENITQGDNNILNQAVTNLFGGDTNVSTIVEKIRQGDTNVFENLNMENLESTTIQQIFNEVQNLTTEKTRIVEKIKENFMEADLEALEAKKIIPILMNVPVGKRTRSIGQGDAGSSSERMTFARPTRTVRDSFVTIGYQQ